MNNGWLAVLLAFSMAFPLAVGSRAGEFEQMKDQSNMPFGEGLRDAVGAPVVVAGNPSALSQAASAASSTGAKSQPGKLEVPPPGPVQDVAGQSSFFSRARAGLQKLGQHGLFGLGAALAFVPGMASAQRAAAAWPTGDIITAAALTLGTVGILLWVLHFNRTTLEEMIREDVAALTKVIDAKRPELMKIPGVVNVEVLPIRLGEGDDSFASAYAVITVDHLGPDNKALLPQPDTSHWNPGVRPPQNAVWVGVLDGWPVVVALR